MLCFSGKVLKLEVRLQKRYQILVDSHLNALQAIAAGIKALPGTGTAFAATQAAWRFFRNPEVTLCNLVRPLQDVGREASWHSASPYVLIAFDWSKMDYDGHANKHDLTQLSQELDRGYELATCLLVDAENGSPLAPMGLSVLCSKGMYTTESDALQPRVGHLEQVLPWMNASRSWGLEKRPVFVVDREADSVKQLRAWDEAGHLFLVRVDDRWMNFRGDPQKLSSVATTLRAEGGFTAHGEIALRGRRGVRWVAETEVILDQPGWGTTPEGKRHRVPGRPLRVRLVVVQMRDDEGELLAEWTLLTNVWDEPPVQIANWYYWRWKIESFHKLLKSAGLELEAWLQESALAITKRLLVGCMACVTVWMLERQTTPEATACQRFLVRLSGRQMKRSRPVTSPALLCGLHLLLRMLQVLQTHTIDELRTYAAIAAPRLRPSG